jgi:hypothetical protein
MKTALALVHHANQFLITEGYENREGLADVLGSREAGQGLAYILHLHRRFEIPLNLHLSGTLLEAIAWHAPEFLEEVRELNATGLVEFVGSCYGQNIMRFFDADYNRRQMNEELDLYRLHLNIDPSSVQVFWPPERVWDTQRLAPVLRHAQLLNNGYRYVLVDDRNLVRSRDEFDEKLPCHPELYATHEIDRGLGLIALPIATALRRSIPPREKEDWERVRHELEALLVHGSQAFEDEALAIYADDMEKVSGIWGKERVDEYERFLEWIASSSWLRPTRLSDWTKEHKPVDKRALLTGTFAELAKEFEAGEGYERWFFSEAWAPYRAHFTWAQQQVKSRAQSGADASLIELAEKQLLVSAWETAWHTPATGAHGDADPEHHSKPSPWAAAIASHVRHAAVIAEAAHWMQHGDGSAHAYLEDVDNDGEQEVVLKNDSLFAVITPRWGGRLVSLFSLTGDRGAMMVGNPCDDWNFLEDLNRFMEVPRNHPGCFADVGGENRCFCIQELRAQEGSASVTLKADNGLVKTLSVNANEFNTAYRLPKEMRCIEVDCGLSPDYLRLLREGSPALTISEDVRSRECSTESCGIAVHLPSNAGVEFVQPPQTTFGHGCLVRVRSTTRAFELQLRVRRTAKEQTLPEAA